MVVLYLKRDTAWTVCYRERIMLCPVDCRAVRETCFSPSAFAGDAFSVVSRIHVGGGPPRETEVKPDRQGRRSKTNCDSTSALLIGNSISGIYGSQGTCHYPLSYEEALPCETGATWRLREGVVAKNYRVAALVIDALWGSTVSHVLSLNRQACERISIASHRLPTPCSDNRRQSVSDNAPRNTPGPAFEGYFEWPGFACDLAIVEQELRWLVFEQARPSIQGRAWTAMVKGLASLCTRSLRSSGCCPTLRLVLLRASGFFQSAEKTEYVNTGP